MMSMMSRMSMMSITCTCDEYVRMMRDEADEG